LNTLFPGSFFLGKVKGGVNPLLFDTMVTGKVRGKKTGLQGNTYSDGSELGEPRDSHKPKRAF
jgi:hypothetical protein